MIFSLTVAVQFVYFWSEIEYFLALRRNRWNACLAKVVLLFLREFLGVYTVSVYCAIWLAKTALKILRCFLFVQSYHEMTCDWLMQVAIFKPIQQLCLHYEFETCRPHVHIFLSRNQLYSFYFGLKIHSPYQHSVSYPTSSWKPAVNAVVFLHGSSTLKYNPSHVTKLTAVCDECKNSPTVWLVRSSREVSKVTKTNILIGWQKKYLAHLAAGSTPRQL